MGAIRNIAPMAFPPHDPTPRDEATEAAALRDAGVRRVRCATRWLAAGAIGLTGAIAGFVVQQSPPTKASAASDSSSASSGASSSSSSGSSQDGSSSSDDQSYGYDDGGTYSGSPQAPQQAPQSAQQSATPSTSSGAS